MSLFNELNTNVLNRTNQVHAAAALVATRIFNDLMIDSFKEQSKRVAEVTDIKFDLVHYRAIFSCSEPNFSWIDFTIVGQPFADAVAVLLKACDDITRSEVISIIDTHILKCASCHGLLLTKEWSSGLTGTKFQVASADAHEDLEANS